VFAARRRPFLTRVIQGPKHHITGTVPPTVSDFTGRDYQRQAVVVTPGVKLSKEAYGYMRLYVTRLCYEYNSDA
jgi:hypothetical protein